MVKIYICIFVNRTASFSVVLNKERHHDFNI